MKYGTDGDPGVIEKILLVDQEYWVNNLVKNMTVYAVKPKQKSPEHHRNPRSIYDITSAITSSQNMKGIKPIASAGMIARYKKNKDVTPESPQDLGTCFIIPTQWMSIDSTGAIYVDIDSAPDQHIRGAYRDGINVRPIPAGVKSGRIYDIVFGYDIPGSMDKFPGGPAMVDMSNYITHASALTRKKILAYYRAHPDVAKNLYMRNVPESLMGNARCHEHTHFHINLLSLITCHFHHT